MLLKIILIFLLILLQIIINKLYCSVLGLNDFDIKSLQNITFIIISLIILFILLFL